ncbi:MAG: tetratricopeptide repeat protein, partial [candidate division Zixibacteria bacterium]|nr:tetratricopeptide repeat protein [candidate division Zixibacteria bacterium]
LGLVSQGLYHYANSDYEQALCTFRQALKVDSTFPEVNLNTGVCFLQLGTTDSAYYYFDRERTFNPQRPKTFVNLASLHLINKRYDAAVREAEHALTIMPYDVTANIVLLRAASRDQLISNDSLVSLTMVAAARTDDDLYLLNDAAVLLTHRGEPERAETILRRALNSHPSPIETDDQAFDRNFRNDLANRNLELAQTHYQLGYLAGLTGHYREAISHSRQAIERDSLLVEAYVNLISGYFSTGKVALADSVLKTANKRFPASSLIDQLQEYRLR